MSTNRLSNVFSISAMIISLVSLAITVFIYFETKRINGYQLNIGLQYESEKILMTHDNLLLLHDITPEEIKNDNITIEEFYYIFSSLRASEAYYIVHNKANAISKLRTHFLNNDKVELVYKKYLRNKLISSPVFINLIDKYYLDKNNPSYYNP